MADPVTSQIVGEDVNAFSLIDVSVSDDDFLLASSSDVGIVGKSGDLVDGAHINQQLDSMELWRPRKSGKCNLRKSMAWDSAFFTSAGVLEPEELSSIMEGAETGMKQKHCLPGIQEDLSKSTDSISTFESDLTLESLEADLFCDIRASIQRCSRPSTMGNCNETKIHVGESKNGCSAKTVEPSSGNVVKPKLVSKKLNPSVQGPVKSLKAGSGCKQVAKPAVRSRETSSLLPRPPEGAGKPTLIGTTATKRLSVGAGRTKFEGNTAGNSKGKGISVQKASRLAESRNIAPKAVSKSSSGSSVLSRAPVRSSHSSCDSTTSRASENIRKSQCDVVGRKMDKNTNLLPSPRIRVPSRVAVKSKSQTGESNLSDYVKCTAKLSSSISPASSISEWSTESSSSTATVKQKHIGMKPSPNSVVEMLNQSAKKPSTRTTESLSHPGSAKPSGLRMPSAKIGFFDGVKTGSKTPGPSSRSRSALPSSLPNSAAGIGTPSEPTNKGKPGNNPVKMTSVIVGTATPEPCRIHACVKPTVHKDHSAGLKKASNVENVDNVFEISCKLLESGSPYSTIGEVDNVEEGKHVADSHSGDRKGSYTQRKNINLGGKLTSINDQASVVAVDGFNISDVTDSQKNLSVIPTSKVGQRNNSDSINGDNLNPSPDVSDADTLKIVNFHSCLDVGGIVGHVATNENQDLLCEKKEAKQNDSAESQMDRQEKCIRTADQQTEMNRETNGNFQSQNVIGNENSSSNIKHLCEDRQTDSAQSAKLISCSLPLPCTVASPGTRMPFAVKNSDPNIIETCNLSSGTAVGTLNVNFMPSLEEPQTKFI